MVSWRGRLALVESADLRLSARRLDTSRAQWAVACRLRFGGRPPLGPLRFLALFLLAGIAGAVAFLVVHPFGLEPVVGASAAISGAVAAAMRFAFEPGAPLGPGRNFSVADDRAYSVPALPLSRVFRDGRAVTFLLVWFGCNILFGAFARPLGIGDASVAWEAHIGGFLFGLLAFSFFDPMPDQTPALEPELEPDFKASTSSQASGPRHVP